MRLPAVAEDSGVDMEYSDGSREEVPDSVIVQTEMLLLWLVLRYNWSAA